MLILNPMLSERYDVRLNIDLPGSYKSINQSMGKHQVI